MISYKVFFKLKNLVPTQRYTILFLSSSNFKHSRTADTWMKTEFYFTSYSPLGMVRVNTDKLLSLCQHESTNILYSNRLYKVHYFLTLASEAKYFSFIPNIALY